MIHNYTQSRVDSVCPPKNKNKVGTFYHNKGKNKINNYNEKICDIYYLSYLLYVYTIFNVKEF